MSVQKYGQTWVACKPQGNATPLIIQNLEPGLDINGCPLARGN